MDTHELISKLYRLASYTPPRSYLDEDGYIVEPEVSALEEEERRAAYKDLADELRPECQKYAELVKALIESWMICQLVDREHLFEMSRAGIAVAGERDRAEAKKRKQEKQ
jgi:hypothetical protein